LSAFAQFLKSALWMKQASWCVFSTKRGVLKAKSALWMEQASWCEFSTKRGILKGLLGFAHVVWDHSR
jgi:hypothetical protein